MTAATSPTMMPAQSAPAPRRRVRTTRRSGTGMLFVAPLAVVVAVIFLVPLGVLVFMSF